MALCMACGLYGLELPSSVDVATADNGIDDIGDQMFVSSLHDDSNGANGVAGGEAAAGGSGRTRWSA